MTQGRMIFKDAQMEKSAVPFRQGGRDAYSMVMTLRELDDCLPDREGGQDLDKFTTVNRPPADEARPEHPGLHETQRGLDTGKFHNLSKAG